MEERILNELGKKILVAASVVIALVSIGACIYVIGDHMVDKAKSKNKAKTTSYDSYIKLGDYKGISVNKPVYTEDDVTSEELDEEIEYELSEYEQWEEVSRKAKKNDKVNVVYTAYIDGEKSEDYSYEEEDGYDMVIGEEEICKDFDTALTKLKVGQTKKFDITYEKDYADEDLAGQTIAYEITLNSVSKCTYKPELNDAFVSENLGYDTAEEYRKSLLDNLISYYQEEADSAVVTDIWTKVLEQTELKDYTDDMYQTARETLQAQYEETASMWGMEVEEYKEFMGYTEEDEKEEILEQIKSDLAIKAIVELEDLSLSEEEYQNIAAEYVESEGYETLEELESVYTKDSLMEVFIQTKVEDILLKYANIKEMSVAEYDALEQEEDEEVEAEEIEDEVENTENGKEEEETNS